MGNAIEKWLDIAAAIFALVAAAFWFVSAYGKLPPMITYWGATPEADAFYQAVKFGALMNRWAAAFQAAQPPARE